MAGGGVAWVVHCEARLAERHPTGRQVERDNHGAALRADRRQRDLEEAVDVGRGQLVASVSAFARRSVRIDHQHANRHQRAAHGDQIVRLRLRRIEREAQERTLARQRVVRPPAVPAGGRGGERGEGFRAGAGSEAAPVLRRRAGRPRARSGERQQHRPQQQRQPNGRPGNDPARHGLLLRSTR